MIIVVGGKRSGNTIRLAQVALEQGVRVRHVETADQVLPADFDGIRAIGITAGASTPNWQIRTLVEKLRQIDLKTRSGIYPKLRLFADYTIMTYMWAALGGAGLTLACSALQENKVDFTAAIVTALFVFSMHLINRIQESSGALRFNTPEIAEFYSRHQKILRTIGGVAALMSVLISYFLGWLSMIMVMSMIVTGILYPLPILVSMRIFGGRWSSLKDIPGSKTPLVSIGWAMSAAIIPSFSGELWAGISSIVVSFIFAAGMVFWRTALSDLIDIQGDRIGGRETIPILFGGRATEKILNITLLFLSCLLILSSLEGWTSKFGYLLLINVMIFKFFFDFYKKGHLVDRLLFEGLVDGNFVLAGVVSIIYASAP
jgi:4-hydroxy-3-methylbut-2-enyl diphosphate reductase